MYEASLEDVYKQINDCLAREDYRNANALTWPALDQFPTDPQLLFYASHLFTLEGRLVPALLCAQRSQELDPRGSSYTNMGALYRRMNLPEPAYACLEEAVGYDPKNKHTWNNLAASYVNEGNPEAGLVAAKEALRLDRKFAKARWNKGLLELELGNFKEGFRDYRAGLVAGERLVKNYATGDAPEPALLHRISQLKGWAKSNGKRPRVALWGEQGMGDELMFATCLADLHEYADIVFDCHPRLIEIFRRSFPFISSFHPTRKEAEMPWYADIEPCQFKCSIGELPRLFRREYQDFADAAERYQPWYKPDPEKVHMYRDALQTLSPGMRYVGVAWTGGIISTQRWYRCAQLEELKRILHHPHIQPVSLQYEDDYKHIGQYLNDHGKLVLRFPGITTHFDYNHHHDLICSLDAVVTVCSTTAHLAAASGVPTYVLVPEKPAWRYGLKGKDWFLYGPGPKLYRKRLQEGPWKEAVEELAIDLFNDLGLEDYQNL